MKRFPFSLIPILLVLYWYCFGELDLLTVRFCVRTYRGCCGPREPTVLMSTQTSPLLSCSRPTTFHLKPRVSGQYTELVCFVGTKKLQ